MDNKKIFNIIYSLSIVGIVGAMFMAIYNLAFADSTFDITPEIENMFKTTNVLIIVFVCIILTIIIINIFTKNKYFWFEIAFVFLAMIVTIILMSLNKKSLSTNAYIMVWFEVLSSCFLLLISRICNFFIDKQKKTEVQNEENN